MSKQTDDYKHLVHALVRFQEAEDLLAAWLDLVPSKLHDKAIDEAADQIDARNNLGSEVC